MAGWLPLLAALSAFSSMLLLVGGLARVPRREQLRERLERLSAVRREEPGGLDEALRLPVTDRLLRPLAATIARPIERFTPRRVTERTQRTLEYAGLAPPLDAALLIALRVLAGLGFGILGAALALMTTSSLGLCLALGTGSGLLAAMAPALWVSRRARQRQELIRADLPDMLDLLTLCIGVLPFERAIETVIEHSQLAIRDELIHTRNDMRLFGRVEALRALGRRAGVEEISAFVTAVVQASQLGTTIEQVLRAFTHDMRLRRRQRAEKIAREAPVKMLFPLVLLVFPPLFIVILGPSIPQIIHSVAPGFPL